MIDRFEKGNTCKYFLSQGNSLNKIMKTARFSDTIRNIFRHKISFLAIMSIMVLGVGGILGLFFLGESINRCITDYYNKHNFKDFEIVSNMGVTDDDIDRISMMPSIKDVEGVFKTDVILAGNGISKSVDAVSITERISIPYIVEGEMPSEPDECAISYDVMKSMGLGVGDKVHICVEKDRLDGLIREKVFTITGSVYHPDYVSRMTADYLILNMNAFDKSVMSDAYTGMFVKASVSGRTGVYSKKYISFRDSLEKELNSVTRQLAEERGTRVKDESVDKYNNAKEEVDKGLSEAYDKLTDAERVLSENLASGMEKLESGEDELKNGNDELNSKLKNAKDKLKSGETQLKGELDNGLSKIKEGEKEADSKLDAALDELIKGEKEYSEGLKEFSDGRHKYDEGIKEIEVADAKLKAAKELLDYGNETYNKMVSQIDTAMNELADTVDPFFSKLDNAVERADRIITEIFEPYMEPPASWEEFKSKYVELKSLRIRFRNESGIDKLPAAYDFVKASDDFISLYAGEIYDWFLRIGITDAPDPSGLSTVFSVIEKRISSLDEELRTSKEKLESGQRQYDEAKRKYDTEVSAANIDQAKQKLNDGEAKLNEGRLKLDSGWNEYKQGKNEARQKIEDARNKYDEGSREGTDKLLSAWHEYDSGRDEADKKIGEGTKELIDGWKTYYEKRDEGNEKIRSGWDEYNENEEKAKNELLQAEDRIDNFPECVYIVMNRNLNAGYSEIKVFYDAVISMASFFSPLFAILGSIVCFSTIAIIIDGQKKQVGTVKAFGFYNREIHNKYLIFGMTATALGCILGVPIARVIASMVLATLNDSFVSGQIPNKTVWWIAIVFILVTMAVAAIVVFYSCSLLIRCSATGLLSGNEPKKRTKKNGFGNKKGTIYSKLIVNNIFMDAERVIVSLVVIGGSTLLIGSGFTIYASVTESHEIQFDINDYDFNIKISGADRESLCEQAEDILESSDAEYLPATYEYMIYDSDSRYGAMAVLCADSEKISEFFDIRDYDGTRSDIKSMGMTVRLKFREIEGIDKGDSFILFDSKLEPHEAYITDDYFNPFDQQAVISNEAYESQFGEKNKVNTICVRCGSVPETELKERLSALSEYIVIEEAYGFADKAKLAKQLCTMLAIITIVISMLMSILILINMTNILVDRRLGELLIMRVNGFYQKQVIGYLLRESALVTCFGIFIGLVTGVPFSTVLIKSFEGERSMYIRSPYVWVWIVAVLFNLIFAALIDFISFRKIKDVPLTNITV